MTDLVASAKPAVVLDAHEETGTNPHLGNAISAGSLMALAGFGAGWSVVTDNPYAPVSAGLFLLMILAFALVMGRYNAWVQG